MKILSLCISLFLCVTGSALADRFHWQTGDIIAQVGEGGQSQMIKNATNSKWTHVGIVIQSKGKFMVFEGHTIINSCGVITRCIAPS